MTKTHDYTVVRDGVVYAQQFKRWEVTPGFPAVVRENPYYFSKVFLESFVSSHPDGSWKPDRPGNWAEDIQNSTVFPVPNSVRNRAYSKYMRSLREGNASLGVTLGSFRQSRDMIINRAAWAQRKLTEDDYKIKKTRRRVYKTRRARRVAFADLHLEIIFGWQPLFEDIFKALTIVSEEVGSPAYIRGSATGFATRESRSSGFLTERRVAEAACRVTYASMCSVSNPNMWMANRLGLINPALVAWDLIPWSWVVGMFVNANALIGSVTDTVGLSISGQSQTLSATGGVTVTSHLSYPYVADRSYTYRHRAKVRKLGAIPGPTVEFRLPDLNWSLAATAFSVVTQRVKRWNSLLSIPFS